MQFYSCKKSTIKTIIASFLLIAAFIANSCRKDDKNNPANAANNPVALEMQKWFGAQKFDTLTLIAINKYRANIQWASASALNGDTTAAYDFVPVKLDTVAKFDNTQLTLNKYLVLTKVKGTITGSALVEVLGNKASESGFTQLVANYGHKTEGSFTGMISLSIC